MSISGVPRFNPSVTTPQTLNRTKSTSTSGDDAILSFGSQRDDLKIANTPQNNEQLKISNTVSTETKRLLGTYNVSKQYNEVKNIEKGLRRSQFCIVAGNAKLSIKDIGDKISNLIDSISTECESCKTEDEVKNVVKKFEQEILQEKCKANIFTQRTHKAMQISNKLDSLKGDPKKEKLLEQIDTGKIIEDLTKTPDIDKLDQALKEEDNDNQNSTKTEDTLQKAVKEDPISNVINKLTEVIDDNDKMNNKEYMEAISPYIRKDSNSFQTQTNNPFEQNNNPLGNMNNNPFGNIIAQNKKNPFLS